jgi:hypothetical protein
VKHQYKKTIEPFLKDGHDLLRSSRLARVSLLVSFFLLVAMVALPVWRLMPLASELPFIALHYNIYLGVDQFGSVYQIFLLPLLGLFFLLLNFVIGVIAWRKQKILTFFFMAATPLLESLLLVATVLIILTNV